MDGAWALLTAALKARCATAISAPDRYFRAFAVPTPLAGVNPHIPPIRSKTWKGDRPEFDKTAGALVGKHVPEEPLPSSRGPGLGPTYPRRRADVKARGGVRAKTAFHRRSAEGGRRAALF